MAPREAFKLGVIAELNSLAHHFETGVSAECDSLVTNGRHLQRHALFAKLGCLVQNLSLNVRIQRTGQTLVRGHQNERGLTGLNLVLDEERMAVVRTGLARCAMMLRTLSAYGRAARIRS